jgi:hypothetical protein
LKLLFDLISNVFQITYMDGTLFTGFYHSADQFHSIEGLTASVPLDNQKRKPFNDLIGCKTLSAGKALPPPTDRSPFLGWSGINDLAFCQAADWAANKTTSHLIPPLEGGEHS